MLLASNAFAPRKELDASQPHDQPAPDAERIGRQPGAWARLEAAAPHQPDADVFHLWSENEPAFHLFRSVETQFVYDQGLPTGLDYCRVRSAPAFRRIARDLRESVFEDICWMERAWLRERIRLHNEAVARARQRSGPALPR